MIKDFWLDLPGKDVWKDERFRIPWSAVTSDPSDERDATLGYEQARDELAEVVRRLESGAGTLEEALALWERGEQLARICQEWLDGARRRLDAAVANERPPAR